MKINFPENHDDSFCLGSFSQEAIEAFKRAMVNPFLNERLGITLTYIAPFKRTSEDDLLQQFVIFPCGFESDNDEKKGPRL